MRPIAIVPRPGHDIGVELHDAIICLHNAGIYERNAVAGQVFALLWVDDESIAQSVEILRNAGFRATALTISHLQH